MSFFSDLMKKWHKKYVEDEDDKTRIHHSTSYHTYFQGYSEKKVLADNAAGYTIRREYTAHYLAFTEDRRKWIRCKVFYALLYALSAALTLLALFSGARSNRAGWVAVFGVLQMVMLLLMLIPLGNYVAAPMHMKMGEFNISAKRLGHFSFPASALAGLYLLLSLIWYPVAGSAPRGADLWCLLCQLFSTAAIVTLCTVEARTKYHRIANKAEARPGFDNEIW